MNRIRKFLLPVIVLLAFLTGCTLIHPQVPATPAPEVTATPAAVSPTPEVTPTPVTPEPSASAETVLDEHGVYDTKDEVALYIHTYGKLPENFMTKKEARKQGWESGALNRTIKGMCIGGDVFGNNEKLLPKKKGRVYYECDIGTIKKKSRGAERIVFSNDGLIYYSDDHYESFTLLYGDEDQ